MMFVEDPGVSIASGRVDDDNNNSIKFVFLFSSSDALPYVSIDDSRMRKAHRCHSWVWQKERVTPLDLWLLTYFVYMWITFPTLFTHLGFIPLSSSTSIMFPGYCNEYIRIIKYSLRQRYIFFLKRIISERYIFICSVFVFEKNYIMKK